MKLFLDTSTFLKIFIEEAGSTEVRQQVTDADELALSSICLPESFATLNRLRRDKKLTKQDYEVLKADILEFVQQIQVLELDYPVIKRSIEVSEKAPVKGMDSIHLATAINWESDQFYTADKQQASAGKSNGLKVKLIK